MDRERCPLCDGDYQNVDSHLFAAHKITTAELKRRFAGPVKEDNMGDCPHCAVKDSEIKRLGEKLSEERQARETERDGLSKQLQARAQPTYPTVDEFLRHCEDGSCAQHAAQWQAVKARMVEDAWANLPKEELERRAREAGLVPDRIEVRL